jgi:hypothetical protein
MVLKEREVTVSSQQDQRLEQRSPGRLIVCDILGRVPADFHTLRTCLTSMPRFVPL